MDVEISFCVVNTNGGELLTRCLDAVRAQRAELVPSSELLVLDNASDDGSAEAVRARGEDIELVAIAERRGKALNDSELMRRARGRYCLLLNEDSELLPGAAAALYGALEADPRAACAVAALRRPDGAPQASAWRFPSVTTALAGALMLARRFTVQSTRRATPAASTGDSRPRCAVRRDAALAVGWMDPEFFVYSDEVDFQKRLADAGWHSLYVPAAVAIHHEQLVDRRAAGAADRRERPRARPLHAQAPRRARGGARALADGVDLRRARAGRARATRSRRAPLPRRRRRGAVAVARRGTCARRRAHTTRARRARLSTLDAAALRPRAALPDDPPGERADPLELGRRKKPIGAQQRQDRAPRERRAAGTRRRRAVGSSSSPATETATSTASTRAEPAPFEADLEDIAGSAGRSRAIIAV